VLKDPQLEGDSLTCAVDMLEGNLPPKGELVPVFIDPFGRPLSPVSAAGMHRRAAPEPPLKTSSSREEERPK